MTAEIKKVVLRYCDTPMARSKGLLGKCDEDCKNCFCCIEMDSNGNSEHVNVRSDRKRIFVGK